MKNNIYYEIYDYDSSIIDFDKTTDITDLSNIRMIVKKTNERKEVSFKVRAVDRITEQKTDFPKPFVIIVNKNVPPDVSNFVYNGPIEGKANTTDTVFFYGVVDSFTGVDDLNYSIRNINGNGIAFNKIDNIKELEKVQITYLDVESDTDTTFEVFVSDGKYNGTVHCANINIKTIASNIIPDPLFIDPPIHLNVKENEYYYGTTVVTGINDIATFSIENGEASLDGGENYVTSGLINPNQSMTIRGIANDTVNTVKLFISGEEAVMTIVNTTKQLNDFILIPSVHHNAIYDNFYYSSAIITGILDRSNWVIDNGEGSVDGGLSFNKTGVIYPNQTLIVRGKANISGSNIVTVTVDNNKTGVMTINTDQDISPDCYLLEPLAHEVVEKDRYYYSTTLITGINDAVTWSVDEGEGSVDGGNTFSKSGEVRNNQVIIVRSKPDINKKKRVILNVNGKTSFMLLNGVEEELSLDEPDCFSIIPPVHDNTELDKEYSGVATITGIEGKVKWIVNNGEGSTDGINWSISGVVENNQKIYVRGFGKSTLNNVSLHIGKQCAYMLLIPREESEELYSPCCIRIVPPVHLNVEIGEQYTGKAMITGLSGDAYFTIIDGYVLNQNGNEVQTGIVQNGQELTIVGIGDKVIKSVGLTINDKSAFMTMIPKEVVNDDDGNEDSVNEVTQDVTKECCNCGTSTTPTPTPPPNLKKCGDALNATGGAGTYTASYDLSTSNDGDLTLTYNALSVPDRFIVKQGSTTLFDSGFVSGSKVVKIPFVKANGTIITLQVIGNTSGGTVWDAKLDCPK